VLDELVADQSALDHALGPVELDGISTLHNDADLTILRVAWTPGMALNPHEHRMWAVIGMYRGQEDNAFYRRAPAGLDPAGGRDIRIGDVLVLGDDVIHSVANTGRDFAVALHVYGGDFVHQPRSQWLPPALEDWVVNGTTFRAIDPATHQLDDQTAVTVPETCSVIEVSQTLRCGNSVWR